MIQFESRKRGNGGRSVARADIRVRMAITNGRADRYRVSISTAALAKMEGEEDYFQIGYDPAVPMCLYVKRSDKENGYHLTFSSRKSGKGRMYFTTPVPTGMRCSYAFCGDYWLERTAVEGVYMVDIDHQITRKEK